mgnify:FL=1|jgi:hypothetical protein
MLLTLICIVVLVVGIILNRIADEGGIWVLEGVGLICMLLGTICGFVLYSVSFQLILVLIWKSKRIRSNTKHY